MDIHDLLKLSQKIRLGLESFKNTLDSRGNYQNFYRFPFGCCGDTTMIVNHILSNKGYGKACYISARKERSHTSHAWTLIEDYCIDLTADQFDGYKENSVIVVPKNEYPLNKIYPVQKESFWPLDNQYLIDIYDYLVFNGYI